MLQSVWCDLSPLNKKNSPLSPLNNKQLTPHPTRTHRRSRRGHNRTSRAACSRQNYFFAAVLQGSSRGYGQAVRQAVACALGCSRERRRASVRQAPKQMFRHLARLSSLHLKPPCHSTQNTGPYQRPELIQRPLIRTLTAGWVVDEATRQAGGGGRSPVIGELPHAPTHVPRK